MNKLYLKLSVIGMSIALASISAMQAATVVYNIAPAANNHTNLFTGPARITGITVNSGINGGVNLTYAFSDFPGTNAANGWGAFLQTNAAYMQINQYTTNITRILTNFGGWWTNADGSTNSVVISNALWTYTNYVGATSNAWRIIAQGSVASNTISTITLPAGGIPVIYGLGFTNNALAVGSSVTITYNPAF